MCFRGELSIKQNFWLARTAEHDFSHNRTFFNASPFLRTPGAHVPLCFTSLRDFVLYEPTCLQAFIFYMPSYLCALSLSYVLTYLRTFFFYLSAFVFNVAPCLCALFLYIPTLKKFINVVRKSQLNFIPVKLIIFFPYNNYLKLVWNSKCHFLQLYFELDLRQQTFRKNCIYQKLLSIKTRWVLMKKSNYFFSTRFW